MPREPLPDLPIALSYSNISDYLNCPKQFWHKDLKKDIAKEIKSHAQYGGTKVHDYLKKRLKIREPLPRDYQQHEGICVTLEQHPSVKHMELELGIDAYGRPCDFWDAGVRLRGKLDLACSAAPYALLVDWKSGRRWEDALELKIQAVLLQARYPELTRISGFYYWLRDSAVGKLHEIDTEAAWLNIRDIAMAIAGRVKRHDWPPDQGPLCPWCPVPKGFPTDPLDPVCQYRKDKP